MSTSTMSITTNSVARCRPMVALEKITNIELLDTTATDEATSSQATTGKKHTKDLNHHFIRSGKKDLVKKSSFVALKNEKVAIH
nr:hypothetical protein CFP56_49684 [Quercus suber]